VPDQFQRLVDGRLDVGLGRASLAPPAVASELFRLDPLGVLVAEEHDLGELPVIPVATLATEPMLLAEEERAPEFNQFVIELCRSVGFIPTLYRGTVDSIRTSVDLVVQRRCVLRAPSSCVPAASGMVWRPLVARRRAIRRRCCGGPVTPLSMSTPSSVVPGRSRRLGWLEPPGQATG
jgi:hypothetical protein